MPTYVYECPEDLEVTERNVPMDNRDAQNCQMCGAALIRKIVFEGLVWAPTAGGMR